MAKGRALHLLVVERHRDMLCVLELYLESLGHTARFAANAREALELARSGERFDALLDDIDAADAHCWDLPATLKRDGVWLPAAISLGDWRTDADSGRSRAAGFAAHLAKPFKPEHLEEALRTVLCAEGAVF